MTRPRTLPLLIALVAPILGVACGDGGSPASPSALPSATSATITGTALVAGSSGVTQLGAQSVGATASAADQIRVCVVGTDVCANVDGTGTFVLSGDFADDVELHFDGRGQSVRVTVVDVQPGETITIRVELNGNRGTLEVESRNRDGGSDNELDDPEDERRVSLCHVTGNGSYRLITVSVDAKQTHLDHGDGYPGEAVPTDPSLTFDERCGITALGDQPTPPDDDEGDRSDDEKIALCHRTGNGRYRLIEVAVSAERAHIAHGDGYPDGSSPSDSTLRFDESCSVRSTE